MHHNVTYFRNSPALCKPQLLEKKRAPKPRKPFKHRNIQLACYSPGPHWLAWLRLPAGKVAFPALLWLAQLLLGAASLWPAFDSPSGKRNTTFVGLQQSRIWGWGSIRNESNGGRTALKLVSWHSAGMPCWSYLHFQQKWTPLTGNTSYCRLLGECLDRSAVSPNLSDHLFGFTNITYIFRCCIHTQSCSHT